MTEQESFYLKLDFLNYNRTYKKPNVTPRMTQLQDSLTPHSKATLAHFAFTRHTRHLCTGTTQ